MKYHIDGVSAALGTNEFTLRNGEEVLMMSDPVVAPEDENWVDPATLPEWNQNAYDAVPVPPDPD